MTTAIVDDLAADASFGAAASVGFQRVLVGVDGTATGRDAIALANLLCAPDGHLTLAHVVLVQSRVYRSFDATPAGRTSREMLERERRAAGVMANVTGTFAQSVGSGLHQLAANWDADLLVVGSCSRGSVGRLLRGDDTQGSLSGAHCPVAVAPHGYAARRARIGSIGVVDNGSPESTTALAAARAVADSHGAAVRTVAVGSSGRRRGKELVAFGDQVDLLVVGSRGHAALRRRSLRSISARLARLARCPLLVIPRNYLR